jgi:hypothetical protein
MDTTYSTKHKFNRMFANILSTFVILTMVFPAMSVASAASSSPFLGQWQATDFDGSDMQMTIAGRAGGPFQITWMDKFINYCKGAAGLVRGTGWLDEDDSNLLDADLLLECFTTGDTLSLQLTFRYHPATNTLSLRYNFGQVTIWHRPGRPQAPPPTLNLRVNYGDNWVESFYEGGHMAWVTVTDGDGNVRATSELMTESKDYWGGETGFQTNDAVWHDADGDQMENPPDIQPDDWVFGWVDNGASAQVQIGNISGAIDLANDSIQGTIMAPWFTTPVQVECFDWGSGREQPYDNKDGGSILTNGADPYSCSWAGEWDIQPGQTIGGGYFGSDGNWVANAFSTPHVSLIAFPAVDEIFGYGWPTGSEVYLDINNRFAMLATVQPAPWDENDIMAHFQGQFDLKSGDMVTLSGSGIDLTYTVLNLSVTNVDVVADIVSGTADPGASLSVGPFGFSDQALQVTADGNGNWLAKFVEADIDLVEGMCGRAQMYNSVTDNNTAVDWCIPGPHPTSLIFAHPAYELIEGSNWLPGTEVTLHVDNPANGEGTDYSDTQIVGDDNWLHFHLSDFDLQAGHNITMTDGQYMQTMVVSNLRVTGFNLDAHTVFGVGDPGSEFFIADNGMTVSVNNEGNWSVIYDDLLPGTWWTVIQTYPDGNEVRETFRVPVPVIFAHPAYNVIEGHEWTPGTEVTITIDDPTNGEGVDYTQTATASDNINYLYDTAVHFDLAFDLQAGHIIKMTDGHFTQTMVVSTLRVTGFNLDAHTVFGVGDPSSEFIVADNGMPVSVDDKGNWSVTFDALLPGSWWTVIQTYADGNEMRETFRVPVPVIFAHPAYNVIEGHEWTPNAEVTITIDDPTNGEGVDYTQTAIASDNINYLYDTGVHFDLAFDLEAGDTITMTDGHFTQTMVVSTLRVIGFYLDTHTVFGVGDPGSEFFIADNGMPVSIDDEGKWSATFEDLLPGSWWTIIQRYADGNEMRETFRVPVPVIFAHPAYNVIEGHEWTPGAEVTITIDDPANGEGVDYTQTETASDNINYLYDTAVHFDLAFDLQAGDTITMTDGHFTQTMVVSTLGVTGFDVETHTVFGVGDPGSEFKIADNGMTVPVDDEGNWSATFNELLSGTWWTIIQTYPDGNEVRETFYVP